MIQILKKKSLGNSENRKVRNILRKFVLRYKELMKFDRLMISLTMLYHYQFFDIEKKKKL